MKNLTDRTVHILISVIAAVQVALAVFRVLTVEQAASLAAIPLAFLGGYKTPNEVSREAREKAAKYEELVKGFDQP